MANPFKRDLILIHSPSVYDFRLLKIFKGPIADAIPSSTVFEMYPVGFLSIASFLESNNYNVQIVNIAIKMIMDYNFETEKYIKSLKATVFGIDLHWLPHVNGALTIAKLVKKYHPDSYVLLGGLSATYYDRDLLGYPFIDFVIRGDSTEEPVRQLMQALREKRPLSAVENLTYRDIDRKIVRNPMTFIPSNIDYVSIPDYEYAVHSVFKYFNLENMIPYVKWLNYPLTMIINSRGCTQNCVVCGGSAYACRTVCHRNFPAFRSPEKLVEDIHKIKKFSKAPIFMVHDPRMGGMEHARKFFSMLEGEGLDNELIIEIFFPAGDSYFSMVRNAAPNWSAEITLETPVERLRKINRKFPYSNSMVESTIVYALKNGCRKLDIFFMVGIPMQTYGDAMETVKYYDELLSRIDHQKKVYAYVSPLAPFLDPGSIAFDDSSLGYTVRFRQLEEYSDALQAQCWVDTMSYESKAISRAEIVSASYAVGKGLNDVKLKHGIISKEEHEYVRKRIELAEEVLSELKRAESLPYAEREAVLQKVKGKVDTVNSSTLFNKSELSWKTDRRFNVGIPLMALMMQGFINEVARTIYRAAGIYDQNPFNGERLKTEIAER